MILVDTSVWIDHLHRSDAALVQRLGADDVGCHRDVIEELCLGNLRDRSQVLALLSDLAPFPELDHAELCAFAEQHRLWGRGLSAVDAHLIGSVLLSPGGSLWTRDKRMRAAAVEVGVDVV